MTGISRIQWLLDRGVHPFSGGNDAPPPGDGGTQPPANGGEPPAGGGGEPKWFEGFQSPELKGHKSVTKFKGPEDLAQAYVNLESMMGSRIPIPGPDAKPEQIAEFRAKLGVPAESKGYYDEKGNVIAVPEGISWDKEAESRFVDRFHKAGLTKSQVQDVLTGYIEYIQGENDRQMTLANDAIKDGETKLHEMWGPTYKRNIGLVQRFGQEYGDADWARILETAEIDGVKLGNHPVYHRVIAKAAQNMLEEGLIRGDNLGMSDGDAKAEILKIQSDPKHPYWIKDAVGHEAAVEKMRELFKTAYPS